MEASDLHALPCQSITTFTVTVAISLTLIQQQLQRLRARYIRERQQTRQRQGHTSYTFVASALLLQGCFHPLRCEQVYKHWCKSGEVDFNYCCISKLFCASATHKRFMETHPKVVAKQSNSFIRAEQHFSSKAEQRTKRRAFWWGDLLIWLARTECDRMFVQSPFKFLGFFWRGLPFPHCVCERCFPDWHVKRTVRHTYAKNSICHDKLTHLAQNKRQTSKSSLWTNREKAHFYIFLHSTHRSNL